MRQAVEWQPQVSAQGEDKSQMVAVMKLSEQSFGGRVSPVQLWNLAEGSSGTHCNGLF